MGLKPTVHHNSQEVLSTWLARVLAHFERRLTSAMVGTPIAPAASMQLPDTILGKIKTYLTDPFTWRSVAYLAIKFPLALLFFVIVMVFFIVSLSLMATPFLFHLSTIGILSSDTITGSFSFIQTYWFTLLSGAVGVLLLFITLHVGNGLARVLGLVAQSMLEQRN